MDILQKTFREIKDLDFREVFRTCLFVFDTNTLLDIYRLPAETSEDFKRILEDSNVNDRIWMPFQVYLEISHNRLGTIKAQKATFSKVIDLFKEKIQELENFEKSIDNKLVSFELQKRHSVMKVENYKLNANFNEPIEKLKSFIKDTEKLRDIQPDFESNDAIYKQVVKLFENKIGEPFSDDDLEEIYKEANERFLKNIPPGFEDAKSKELNPDKPEKYSYKYGKQEYIRKYGDLVLWKEILKKAKESNSRYIIFVCNERKPDWWQLDEFKKKIQPRYELLNEIYSECPSVDFFTIFELHQFLKQMVKTFDNFSIKEESIKAAKEIPQIPVEALLEISKNFINRRTYAPSVNESHPSYFVALTSNIVEEFNDSRYDMWHIHLRIRSNIYPKDKDVQLGIYEIISLILSSFQPSFIGGLRFLTINETESVVSFEFNVAEKPQVLLKITEDVKNFMDGYYYDSNKKNPFIITCEPPTYYIKVQISKDFFTGDKYILLNEANYTVVNGKLL